MRDTTIYGLVDCVGTIRYVGKSVRLATRVREHRRTRQWYAGCLVLEFVPAGGDWRAAERRHIAAWNIWGDLENRNAGGEGPTSHTAETCAKISAARKGVLKTPATRAKMSAAQKGHKVSRDARAKMSAAKLGNSNRLGKVATPEARARMSIAQRGNSNHLGKTHTAEARAKMSAAARRRRTTVASATETED